MRADNKGEGGSLALLALINRTLGGKKTVDERDHHARRVRDRAVLRRFDDHPGDFGAVGGRGPDHGQGRLPPFVIPIAVAILVGLFAIQARGTARVGLLFGPVMMIYFVAIAVLGVIAHRRATRRSSWR